MAISKEFIEFFKELHSNNNRDWFHANKKRYEKEVKAPFYDLVAQVIEGMKEFEPDLELEVKNAVFRINRDIRFSKDKSPYKTHVGAVISKGGRKNLLYPGIYLHLSNAGVHIGGGCYKPDKEGLSKIRHAIIQQPKRVKKILADKKFLSFYPNGIVGERNKILPKEFKPYGEKHPLIFQKQYYYMTEYNDETTVLKKDLALFIVQHYEASLGWINFLKETLFNE